MTKKTTAKKVSTTSKGENLNESTTKPKPNPKPIASNSKQKIELINSSLNGRLLHVSITTDIDDDKLVDELHEKIEERIEKKLEESGVKNCIVFVSGPNIELKLM